MKTLSAVLLAVGVTLFSVLLYQTDLAEVWQHLLTLGWAGAAVVFVVYLVTYITDTATWYATLPSAKPRVGWVYRFWQIMMYGDSLNKVLPLASFGGEPVKAILAKRHLGVGYRDCTASLVLFHTVSSVALALFLLFGLGLMLTTDWLDQSYRLAGAVGMTLFAIAIAVLVLLQRRHALSRLTSWIAGDRWGERIDSAIQIIQDIEKRLVTFYTGEPRRFRLALSWAFANWTLGAVEIYLVMMFLGHPVSFADAWLIEAVVVLVRLALFVVPANIGTQEVTFVVICGAITGSPTIGLAAAAVIRARGMLWVLWGLLIGWRLERLSPPAAFAADEVGAS